MKNKVNSKKKTASNAININSVRRREPRRRFVCICCEYVPLVKYGVVLTALKGKKVEICNCCFFSAESGPITHCHNCGHRNGGQGVVSRTDGIVKQFCNECINTKQGISEYYNSPHSDSESVF